MPYVTVGQENSGPIELYYEDHGAGRPVVLIHGWPLSGASWEKQTRALLAAGYRVVTYDRRGFGKSSQPAAGYDYDTLAGDLERLMTKLDLRDAAIFGFSMGGGEVARYLSTYGAGRVAKAGFLGAIPPFLLKTADNPAGGDQEMFDGIQQALLADRPGFLAQFFKNFYNTDVFGGNRISDAAVQLSWNVAVGASPIATHACVKAWQTDFRADLAKIRIPVLVVHGDDDRIVPFAGSGKRTHESIPGSKLVTISGGPHGILWTHGEEVAQAMLEFLK
jgi:non-heme chloroperoxidase